MATTILRVEKIKSFAALRASKAHIMREMNTPNADPQRLHLNKTLIGTDKRISNVKRYYEQRGIKVRKNAVIAFDGLLSLSDEAFQLIDTSKFSELATQFLKDEFKGRVCFAELHLDEKTPHIQFTMLPILNNKLNAREYMNKEKLSGMQKRFYAFMSENLPEAKLEPPKHGQKAKHTTVQDFYRLIENNMDQTVERISQRLEEELMQRAELTHNSLLNALDKHVEAAFSKKRGDVKDQLSTFYNELREQIRELSEKEREEVRGFSHQNHDFAKSVLKAITKEVIEEKKVEKKAPESKPRFKM
ncbi:TPA: plasmid recombination protein [Vibrio parahaemolyticus]|nr:plasmid recombination protein [Vibrio parahaemolyticus]